MLTKFPVFDHLNQIRGDPDCRCSTGNLTADAVLIAVIVDHAGAGNPPLLFHITVKGGGERYQILLLLEKTLPDGEILLLRMEAISAYGETLINQPAWLDQVASATTMTPLCCYEIPSYGKTTFRAEFHIKHVSLLSVR